ncbi:hypothetical protein W02_00810 [Nitrospira sp. KM1]|nr:hypothetical protein W02_00810 [Nitrospira sp. KM1]
MPFDQITTAPFDLLEPHGPLFPHITDEGRAKFLGVPLHAGKKAVEGTKHI